MNNYLRQFFVWIVFFYVGVVSAADRFPRPEFDNNHVIPTPVIPQSSGDIFRIIDFTLFVLAISVATYFIIRKRSRIGVLVTLILSLLYFGFYKMGCICAVGSVQNVTLACFSQNYQISWIIFAIFAIPILFTLFFWRTFCSSVCPLGAIQDIFILKPIKIPNWLEDLFGLIPYLYLGLAILFAATKSAFFICRYDPFVGLFRFSGSIEMIFFASAILMLGVFVARPYCRYLCPYGVLLRWASLFSRRHLTITADKCIKCRLCEDSCPFGAIRKPAPEEIPELREVGVRRLIKLFIFTPLIIIAFSFLGYLSAPYLAEMNPRVAIADQLIKDAEQDSRLVKLTPLRIELIKHGNEIRKDFFLGGTLLGLFLGVVVVCKLISLSRYPTGDTYRPDKMKCLSCARCIPFCPVPPKGLDR